MTRMTAPADRAPSPARSMLRMAGGMIAACTWACSPVPAPNDGAEAGAATATTAGAPATSGPATAEPTAAPTSTATATPAQTVLPAEGPVPDPACTSCLNATVSWGWVGGNAPRRDRSTAEPCRVYRRTRTFSARAGGQPPISCADQLSCDASDTGAGKLAKLVSHPDVQKGLASPMTVYGCDLRPVDGALYGVEVDGGRSFGVGGECQSCNMPRGTCVSPPAAVKELVAFLQGVDEKMLARDPCKAVFGPR